MVVGERDKFFLILNTNNGAWLWASQNLPFLLMIVENAVFNSLKKKPMSFHLLTDVVSR